MRDLPGQPQQINHGTGLERRVAEGEGVKDLNQAAAVEYLLRVECADLASYKQFNTETLGTTPHVTSVTSYVVMGSPKVLRA